MSFSFLNSRTSNSASSFHQAVSNRKPGLRLQNIRRLTTYQSDEHDPLYAPFSHSKGYADLPPAYFQICRLGPLRDDLLIYERVLREEYGIKTKLDIYRGLPHGFRASFSMLKPADKFRGDMVEGMGWLFGTKARDRQNQEFL